MEMEAEPLDLKVDEGSNTGDIPNVSLSPLLPPRGEMPPALGEMPQP
jgi:hypothetical protein